MSYPARSSQDMTAADGFVRGCGIYKIENTATGKAYVGSAVSLYHRQCNHIARLRRGTHHSPKLQNSWNKHGAKAFVFSVLEQVADKQTLASREQYWMDRLGAFERGYNVKPIARSSVGFKLSAETRAKLSAAAKRRPPVSAETRAKMSAASKGRPQTPQSISKRAAAMRGKKLAPPTAAGRMNIAAAQRARLASNPRARNASGQFLREVVAP